MSQSLDEWNTSLQGADLEPKLNALSDISRQLSSTQESLGLTPTDPLLANLGKCLASGHPGLGLATLNCLAGLFAYVSQYQPALIKYVLQYQLVPLIDRIGDSKRLARDRATQVLAELWQAVSVTEAKQGPGTVNGHGGPTGLRASTPSASRLRTPARPRLPLSASSPNMGALSTSASSFMALYERDVKLKAFQHKTARVREQILVWLRHCNKHYPHFPVKRYVSFAVKLLEDPTETVRESAKIVLAHLVGVGGPETLEEITQEIRKRNVRPSLAEAVLGKHAVSGLLATPARPPASGGISGLSLRPPSREGFSDLPRPKTSLGLSGPDSRGFGAEPALVGRALRKASDPVGTPSEAHLRASVPNPVAEFEITPEVAPVRILSSKFLDQEVAAMLPGFAGKEGEDNWMQREKAIIRLRAMVKGGNLDEYAGPFLHHLKVLTDGILKALHSLRTTLQLATTHLLIDLSVVLRARLDPLAELLLHNLLKLCGLTKKLSSQAGYQSACVLVRYASYQPRLFGLLVTALSDKNVSLRTSAIGIVRVLLESHAFPESGERTTDALALLNKALKLALVDATPKVREAAREVYWLYWAGHPTAADAFLGTIDSTTKKQVLREQTKYAHLRRTVVATVATNTGLPAARPVGIAGRHSAPASPPQRPVSRSSDHRPASSTMRPPAAKPCHTLKFASTSSSSSALHTTTTPAAASSGLFSSVSGTHTASRRSETAAVAAMRPRPSSRTGHLPAANGATLPAPRSFDAGCASGGLPSYRSRTPTTSTSTAINSAGGVNAPSSVPVRRYSGSNSGSGKPTATDVPAKPLFSQPPIFKHSSHSASRARSPLASTTASPPLTSPLNRLGASPSKNHQPHFRYEPGVTRSPGALIPAVESPAPLIMSPPQALAPASVATHAMDVDLPSGLELAEQSPSPYPVPAAVTSRHDGGDVFTTPSQSTTAAASPTPTSTATPTPLPTAAPDVARPVDLACTPPPNPAWTMMDISPAKVAVTTPVSPRPAAQHHSNSPLVQPQDSVRPLPLPGATYNTPQLIKMGVYYAITPCADEKLGGLSTLGPTSTLLHPPKFNLPVGSPPQDSDLPALSESVVTTAIERLTAGQVDAELFERLAYCVVQTSVLHQPTTSTATDGGLRPSSDLFNQLAVGLITFLAAPSAHPAFVRHALEILHLMLNRPAESWENRTASGAFEILLHCQANPWDDIAAATDLCLEALVTHLPVCQVQYLLLDFLHATDSPPATTSPDTSSPVLPASFRDTVLRHPACHASGFTLLDVLLPRLTWDEVEAMLPQTMAHVVRGINATHPRVRRAAVGVFAAFQVQGARAATNAMAEDTASPVEGGFPESAPIGPMAVLGEYKSLLSDAQLNLVENVTAERLLHAGLTMG
ncbi:suppressor of tub2 mutation [Tieghemiomyces parasiticus]|uniref:Suppressor of tub2 mutation n=1 Tax=Tieghemiomyces parasiticus TaxID=78921 RepID=A0A9W8AI93_9FUNG|nr:suppressor of tub2 mutation [Tieghemiomyces parasiticus]